MGAEAESFSQADCGLPTQNVDYGLDPENLEGLRLFYKYGVECGVFTQVPQLAFLEQRVVIPAVRL